MTATGCISRRATSLVNPHVGLLFVDFDGGRRLRLNGDARSTTDDPLLAAVPWGAARRPRAVERGLPELPALHPPVAAGRTLAYVPRPSARRRCRTGSAATGPATCSRPATRRTTREPLGASRATPQLLRGAVVLDGAGVEPFECIVQVGPRLLVVPLAAVERTDVREHPARAVAVAKLRLSSATAVS